MRHSTIFFTLILFLNGCMGEHELPANQLNLDTLASLVSTYPMLASTSLKEVKNRAGFKNSSTESLLLTNATWAIENDIAILEPKVAQKAQKLIDEVLDDFDFEIALNASFKISGITLNAIKQEHEQMKKWAQEYGDKSFEDKFNEINDQKANELSCEAIINNPYMKIPKAHFDLASQRNHEMIKKTISGCPELVIKEFIDCMDAFNQIMSAINKYATCEINNMKELEDILNKNMNNSYKEKNNTLDNCMQNNFSRCGFIVEEPGKTK